MNLLASVSEPKRSREYRGELKGLEPRLLNTGCHLTPGLWNGRERVTSKSESSAELNYDLKLQAAHHNKSSSGGTKLRFVAVVARAPIRFCVGLVLKKSHSKRTKEGLRRWRK
jgi:hypothetical protein